MRRQGFERCTLRSYNDGEEVLRPGPASASSDPAAQVVPGLFHLAESMYVFRRL
jgi:hypothetical protein